MALNYVLGSILNDNLQRTANLSFNSTMLYLDVVGRQVGINTAAPRSSLDINGVVTIGNIVLPNVGDVTFGNARLTNVGYPFSPSDAATMGYVDQKTQLYANSNLIISNTTIYPNFTDASIILAPQGGGNLQVPTGNLVVTKSVYASRYYGDAGYLSNVPAGNVNFTNVNSNIVPSQNVVFSLGNSTRQWKELWVSGNTIYIGGTTLSTTAGNLYVGNNEVLFSSSNGSTELNQLAANQISVSGLVTATYFVGDGRFLTNLPQSTYSNANVAAYLPTNNANVKAAYFIGDGSYLTNVTSGSYSNANVAAYLPTDSTITAINANVAATNANVANVNANLSATSANVTILQEQVYTNANVAAYLPMYDGNLTADYVVANTVVVGTTFTKNFTSTTSAPTPANIASFAIDGFNSFSYTITAVDIIGNNCQVTKIIAATINDIVDFSEYGVVSVGNVIGSYDVTTSLGNLVLAVTPNTDNVIEYSISVTNYT